MIIRMCGVETVQKIGNWGHSQYRSENY